MEVCFNCRSLDRDGSGKITINELQESLASLGVPINASTAERMVDMIDVDGSSDISFQEFRRFAILLPKSQVILSMTLTLFLECMPAKRQITCGRSAAGANDVPADGVAMARHQDLCSNQRC